MELCSCPGVNREALVASLATTNTLDLRQLGVEQFPYSCWETLRTAPLPQACASEVGATVQEGQQGQNKFTQYTRYTRL